MSRRSTCRARLTPFVRNNIAASQKWQCQICHELLQASYQIDHIQPLRDQGSNALSNLQALCGSCHVQKSAKENSRAAIWTRMEKEEQETRKSKYFTSNFQLYQQIEKDDF